MTTISLDSVKPFDIHNRVYSPYPSGLDPQTIKTKWFAPRAGTKQIECEGDGTDPAYVWSDTSRFPALPYTMNELIGSVWISPFDGHTETITGIVSHGKQPFLQTDVEIEPGKFSTLGRWTSPERYTIDAVRYDTLTPSNQLGWLLIAYEYTTTMLKTAATNLPATEDLPEPIHHSAPYQALHATKLTEYQNAQSRQVIAIQRFAQVNNLSLPVSLLNAEIIPVTTPARLLEANTSKNELQATDPVSANSAALGNSITSVMQASTAETDQATDNPGVTKNEPQTADPVSMNSAAPESPTPTPILDTISEPCEPTTNTDSGAPKNDAEATTPTIQASANTAAPVTPGDTSTTLNTTKPSEPVTSSDPSVMQDAPETADPANPVHTDPVMLPASTVVPVQTSTKDTDQTDASSDSGATDNGLEAADLVTTNSATSGSSTTMLSQTITSNDSEPVPPASNLDTTMDELEPAAPTSPTNTSSVATNGAQTTQSDPKYDYSATIYARKSEPDGDPETLLATYKKEVEAQKAASNPFKVNKAIPATLYTFQELLGSTWVSLMTAKRETVVAVMPIKSGNPQNRNKAYLLTEDPGVQYPTIGMYDNGRYVIATHVRYDHLVPTAKHKWHLERLKGIRQQLSQVYYNRLTETPDQDKGNDPRETLVAELELALASEIKFTQAFAEQHNQSIPADLVAPAPSLLADATQKANSAKQTQVTVQRPIIPTAPTTPTIVQPKPTRVSTRPTLPPPPDTEKEMLVCSPFAELPPVPHELTNSLRAAQREQITLNKAGQQSQSPLVNRDLYPSTSWTLQQLVGSAWVNLYTGHKVTVKGLYVVSGHYHLATEDVTEKDWPITRPFGAYHHKTQRYYIEHWIRVDNLPPATAIEWEAQPLRHAASKCQQTESEINSLQTVTSKPSNWRSQVTTKKRDLERYMQEACEAAKHLQNYALQNLIPVPADITSQGLIAHYTTKKPRTKSPASAPKPQPMPKPVSEPTASAQRPTPAVTKTTPKPQPSSSTTASKPAPMSKPQAEEKIPAGQLALF